MISRNWVGNASTSVGKPVFLAEPFEAAKDMVLPSGIFGVITSVYHHECQIVWSVPAAVIEAWGCMNFSSRMGLDSAVGELVDLPGPYYGDSEMQMVMLLHTIERNRYPALCRAVERLLDEMMRDAQQAQDGPEQAIV